MLISFLHTFLRYYHTYGTSRNHDGHKYPAYVWLIATYLPFVAVGVMILYYYCKAHEYKILKLHLYSKPLSEDRQQILKEKFPYYKTLSQDARREFRNRIQHFLINKKFISMNDDIQITEEMKVMIAATSIQILFCRESYYLSHFNTIKITSQENIDFNEFRKTKQIEICWESFKNGYTSMIDGYNPGLKTMAMALSLEYHFSKSSIFNRQTFKTFNNLYKKQAEVYIQSGKSKYKDYNQIDRDEYFGVAVEYFFERPEHFHATQPAMYLALSKLLRQDALGIYKYKSGFKS